MRDLFEMAVAPITFAFALSGLIMVPAFYFSYVACANKASLYGLSYTWGPLIECQVKVANDEWVPLGQYRAFEEIKRK